VEYSIAAAFRCPESELLSNLRGFQAKRRRLGASPKAHEELIGRLPKVPRRPLISLRLRPALGGIFPACCAGRLRARVYCSLRDSDGLLRGSGTR
jgi:hypothetical protein